MSDTEFKTDAHTDNMDTPMTLIVQGLLVQGLRSSPEDHPQGEVADERQTDILYLKEVKIYGGGALVAEMAHLSLERAAISGISAGRVTLLGA